MANGRKTRGDKWCYSVYAHKYIELVKRTSQVTAANNEEFDIQVQGKSICIILSLTRYRLNASNYRNDCNVWLIRRLDKKIHNALL